MFNIFSRIMHLWLEHTCFFMSDFPLELILNPKVSALRYLNLELMRPMVQHPLSMAAVPLGITPLLEPPPGLTEVPVIATTEKIKKYSSWKQDI